MSIGGYAGVLLIEAVAGPYFQIVEARAARGRLLADEDTNPAAPAVAVISERLWSLFRKAGVDPINQTITVGGRVAIVVGVVAGSFPGLALRGVATDVWLPAQDREIHHVFGRLRSGATTGQADAEVKSRVSLGEIGARYLRYVVGIRDGLLGSMTRCAWCSCECGEPGALRCVVLVSGASVTNLWIARTSARRGEIAVRLALGAEPGDIRRLVSMEVFLIAVTAGVLSIGSAILTVRLVVELLVRSDRVALSLQPDWRVSDIYRIGDVRGRPRHQPHHREVCVRNRRAGDRVRIRRGWRVHAAVRHRSQPAAGRAGWRIDGAPDSCGALDRSASTGLSYAPGFNPVGAAAGWIDHRSHGHDDERARAVERRVLETARATAGAASLAIGSALPFDGGGLGVSIAADGTRQPLPARLAGVSTGFFSAFGLDLRQGRDFQETDLATRSPVAVISDSAAMALWPKGDVIGRTFRMADFTRLEREWTEYTVIGVVADTVATATHRDGKNRLVFVPYSRQGSPRFAILVRARGATQSSLQLLRVAVAAAGGNLALQDPAQPRRFDSSSVEASGGPPESF